MTWASPLFKRLPTGVSLTAEGARFLQHARNIMAAVNAAQHAPLTEDSAISGTVRIGVSYTVAGYFLPRHYTRFARSYPRIQVGALRTSPQCHRKRAEGRFARPRRHAGLQPAGQEAAGL